ncbi:hypothetical protein [Streptomyces sp. bgisy027]|uniref:hypothetical protein n=1 Tax=Streptomyces sp. bgisy027 TaxID=3413770 RepID=UPI003D702D4A
MNEQREPVRDLTGAAPPDPVGHVPYGVLVRDFAEVAALDAPNSPRAAGLLINTS